MVLELVGAGGHAGGLVNPDATAAEGVPGPLAAVRGRGAVDLDAEGVVAVVLIREVLVTRAHRLPP